VSSIGGGIRASSRDGCLVLALDYLDVMVGEIRMQQRRPTVTRCRLASGTSHALPVLVWLAIVVPDLLPPLTVVRKAVPVADAVTVARTALGSPRGTSGHVTEFAVPTIHSAPIGIARGADGNLWFTENLADKIGRITPQGQITEYRLPERHGAPFRIALGPDGNLWFTEFRGHRIGRITPRGKITEYALPPTPSGNASSITPGPDGNLWFTISGSPAIGTITPTGRVSILTLRGVANAPEAITMGPDGALWFTDYYGDRIGRLTTRGDVREFALPRRLQVPPYVVASPSPITAGVDSALWFTFAFGGAVGRITRDGQVKVFWSADANVKGAAITRGPDGNIWATSEGGISKVASNGTITRYDLPGPYEGPTDITGGPDGNIWFVVPDRQFGHGNSIGRLSLGRDN